MQRSIRLQCRNIRSTARSIVNKTNNDPLLEAMKSVVSKYPEAGSQIFYLILRKTGLKINHKRIERIYTMNKMQLKLRNFPLNANIEKR
jgi:hypothetical protein